MTKWPVQKLTHRTVLKHAEHQDATDIQNNLFFYPNSPGQFKKQVIRHIFNLQTEQNQQPTNI